MKQRTITIRGVPETVLRSLRDSSEAHRRSLNSELVFALERAAAELGKQAPVSVVREPAVRYAPKSKPASPPSLPNRKDAQALAGVCRRYHITWLAVFGSQATGEARPDSDVDVVVDFEPGMTPGFGIQAVAEALSVAFGGRRVDLVTRRGLSPRLRERILATAVPLYGA